MSRLHYDIVDTPSNCEIGRQLFGDHHNVTFTAGNPNDDLDFSPPQRHHDVVLLSSVLQYSHDWRRLLSRLAERRPDTFVLNRLLTGAMPSFTTLQTVQLSWGPHQGTVAGRIPCTFVNHQELQAFFEAVGYTCCLDVFGRSYQEELIHLPTPFCDAELRTLVFSKHTR